MRGKYRNPTKARYVKDFLRRESKNEYYQRNRYVEYLESRKISLKALLAVFLITDGTVDFKRCRMECASGNNILKQIAYYLFYKLGDYPVCLVIGKDGVWRIRITDKKLLNAMRRLSPSFKTSPYRKQSQKSYYSEKQPTLNFLLNVDKDTLRECIRLALSTDGSISRNGNLMLSCSHPLLCKQWKQIFDRVRVRVGIWKNRSSWSGFAGVGTGKRTSLYKFLDLGGFIPGVKVSKKSRYFLGWEKNKVLRYILDKDK